MALVITGKIVSAQVDPQGAAGVLNLEINSGENFALLDVPVAAADIAALTIPGTFTLSVSQP